MCGIAGFIAPQLGQNALSVMLESMISRGPDGEGRYSLGTLYMGMRRLSVIDLEHGWQPMYSLGGDVVVFQNGEIYNYRELRDALKKKGYLFKTKSDTEVLAHGYAEWSIDGLLKRIDGMFAICIFDKRINKLYLARDRFGEKPLFYTLRKKQFAYASSLAAVAAMPWVRETLDPLSLDRYLALHYCPGRKTILYDVNRVLPGEYIVVDVKLLSLTSKKYYQPSLIKQKRLSSIALCNQVVDAVRSRMVADVPVGVFLSGGLDSSLISAIAAKQNRGIDTFSVGFGNPRVDESLHARRVAQFLGTRHHEFIFDARCFSKLLPKVAESLDEPVGDQALLPLFWLCQEAAKHVTVVMSGEGADEIFSGYSYYAPFTTKRSSLLNFAKNILQRKGLLRETGMTSLILDSQAITGSGFPILCGRVERQNLIATPPSQLCRDPWEVEILDWLATANTDLQRASAVDVVSWLPDDLLVKFDRMAMAHSLEGRAPFLAPNLVESGLSLYDKKRRRCGASKVLLREVARSFLPDEIIERKKQGFVLPMQDWLTGWFRDNGGVKPYFGRNGLTSLDMERISSLVQDDINNGICRDRFVFALIMLVEWNCAFFSRVRKIRVV